MHETAGAVVKAMDIGSIREGQGCDYTTWDWYRTPMETQKPHWTKPYFDKGAGEIQMVTYSVPIGDKAILTFDVAPTGK